MLEFISGVYGDYLYRDGEYFDEITFIDWCRRELIASSGVVYDMDSVRRRTCRTILGGGA